MSNKFDSILFFLEYCSSRYKDRPVFTIRRKIRQESIRFGEIPQYLSRVESFFIKERIKPGEKVIIWGLNCPEYALMLLSCFGMSRVAVPIDYRTTKETIEKIIDKTKPQYAFVSKYLKSDFLLQRKIKIYYLEDLLPLIKEIKPIHSWKKILSNQIYNNREQISEIIFTSGTTGVAKGVVIKQKHLLINFQSLANCLPTIKNPRIISILPLSHMLEQVICFLTALYQGATIYYLLRINSYRIMQGFREYRPTHQVFVPQMLKIFWEKIEESAFKEGKLESLKKALNISRFLPFFARRIIFHKVHKMLGGKLQYIGSGGAPMDVNIAVNWQRMGIPVYEGYGATEVTAVATFNRIGSNRLGTVGTSIEDVKIKLSENGEIFINSPALADGYYQDKERTKQSFTSLGFKSGDIGEWDKDGYLRIKGRDAFKIVLPSGEKVYTEDLESRIKKDKYVKEVCVVAKRVAGGDKIHAYFILKSQVKTPLKSLVADINNRLESKEQIISYEIWPENDFPRTNTLKIDRKLMFDFANKEKDLQEVVASMNKQQAQYLDILDVLAKVSGFAKDRINDSDKLTTDLELDSLSRSELVAMAEEYLGVIIDESKISSQTTVADLKRLMTQAEKIEEIFIPLWQFSWWGRIIHKAAIYLILFPIHKFLIQVKFTQRKVPIIPSGSIVIFNHPGILDEICVLRLLFSQGRTDFITNAASYLWIPKVTLIGKMNEIFGGIPLYESGKKFLKVMQTDSDMMDKGFNLLFAPQGTTQRQDKEDPFKPGIGYIVKELDRPVTIIRIKNYREIWPAPKEDVKYAKFKDLLPKKRGTATLVVFPAIYKDWSKMSYLEITNLLEEKYQSL